MAERLIKNLGANQKNAKAIVTDNRLKVKGTDGSIFAIGDCATVDQPKLVASLVQLFKESDLDNDGSLDMNEVTLMLAKQKCNYPQLSFYEDKLIQLYKKMDISGDEKLDLDEFKAVSHFNIINTS
jgi:NADH dehydrogenase